MMGDAGGGAERTELRPLSVGGVLDATFQVYRRHFLAFVTVVAVIAVPIAAFHLIEAIRDGTSGTESLYRLVVYGESTPSSSEGFSGLGLVVSFVSVMSMVITGGAATLVASAAILGRPVHVRTAYGQTVHRLVALVWAELLYLLAVGLLAITCIGLPFAFYVGLGWSLIFQAMLLERCGVTDAMRRSWHLVAGERWRLLACFVLVMLLTTVLSSMPMLLFGGAIQAWNELNQDSQIPLLALQVGEALVGVLGEVLFSAIGTITTTLLYYDLRVRKEGFDLEHRLTLATASDSTSWRPAVDLPSRPDPADPPVAPDSPQR
jgi:hypothetical protein